MPSCQEFTSASIYHATEFTQWRRVTVLLPQKTWWDMISIDMVVTLTFTVPISMTWMWRRVKHNGKRNFLCHWKTQIVLLYPGYLKKELMKIWFPNCLTLFLTLVGLTHNVTWVYQVHNLVFDNSGRYAVLATSVATVCPHIALIQCHWPISCALPFIPITYSFPK